MDLDAIGITQKTFVHCTGVKEGKKKGAENVRFEERCYRMNQVIPRTDGRVIKAARDVHARDRHVFHPTPSFSNTGYGQKRIHRPIYRPGELSPIISLTLPISPLGSEPSVFTYMADSSLLLLPSEVLLIIIQALRPAKMDCWARRFHDSPPAKKDWDALRCSCQVLRELVGSCIAMAVITPSCKHPASFPSHAIMTQLCIKEKYGVSIFGFEVRNALLMLNPSEPSPASTSRIEAVEVHFTDVSGAHMSFCACLGYH